MAKYYINAGYLLFPQLGATAPEPCWLDMPAVRPHLIIPELSDFLVLHGRVTPDEVGGLVLVPRLHEVHLIDDDANWENNIIPHQITFRKCNKANLNKQHGQNAARTQALWATIQTFLRCRSMLESKYFCSALRCYLVCFFFLLHTQERSRSKRLYIKTGAEMFTIHRTAAEQPIVVAALQKDKSSIMLSNPTGMRDR